MCDTFIALPCATADGSVIFGKNSDREPNEAQYLEYRPPQHFNHPETRELKCTYTTISQVEKTLGVLLCRPFWMWGAEMGINEAGVVIGNEAVFTRMPYRKSGGLTGMDLLRLALERSETAEKAMGTIIQLIADHGQGGICGYEDKRFIYHNSFIIADSAAAWVLETAGHLWAAVKVQDTYAISNGLTIGESMDHRHPDVIETARKKGWLKKGRTFHFADCYAHPLITAFAGSRKRRDLSNAGLCRSPLTEARAFEILRDHGPEPYRPDRHYLTNRLCAHAANRITRNSGTNGSMVAHLTPERKTVWVTGTSAPCTSIFKPVRFDGDVLPDIGPAPGAYFDPDALWWRHELFHRKVLQDLEARLPIFRPERDALEARFVEQARAHSKESFIQTSRRLFELSSEITEKWLQKIEACAIRHPLRGGFRRYWNKQNKKAGIPVEY